MKCFQFRPERSLGDVTNTLNEIAIADTMKRVSYCPDCGGSFDTEMGFCPKCDFEGGSGETGIPALADMWDMNMEQLGFLAQMHSVRGWRRLDQKSLIYQLNQIRVVQVEVDEKRSEEEARQRNVERLSEEFLQFAKDRDVESAKARFEVLSDLSEDLDPQLALTMDWLLLPEQIAAALGIDDIPELAFQVNDPAIQQAAREMIEMIGYRTEVDRLLATIDMSSEIPQELLGHHDPVVSSAASSRFERLAGSERARAEQEQEAAGMMRAREGGIDLLNAAQNLEEFPEHLLQHEDLELSQHAERRHQELKERRELLEAIGSAAEAEQIGAELLEHVDEAVARAAKSRRSRLLQARKENLLHRIRNSRDIDAIPEAAFEDPDQQIVKAAVKRQRFLQDVQQQVDSIASIYIPASVAALQSHEDARVREAARLRLRLLDEIPEKLRARGETPRLVKAVDALAAEWAAESEAASRQQAEALGKAGSVGFALGDEVDVSYIGQNFSGTVQGFTDDGEFVEILNDETSTVWPVPFDCVVPR